MARHTRTPLPPPLCPSNSFSLAHHSSSPLFFIVHRDTPKAHQGRVLDTHPTPDRQRSTADGDRESLSLPFKTPPTAPVTCYHDGSALDAQLPTTARTSSRTLQVTAYSPSVPSGTPPTRRSAGYCLLFLRSSGPDPAIPPYSTVEASQTPTHPVDTERRTHPSVSGQRYFPVVHLYTTSLVRIAAVTLGTRQARC